jgi:hypothetical protein
VIQPEEADSVVIAFDFPDYAFEVFSIALENRLKQRRAYVRASCAAGQRANVFGEARSAKG